MYADLPAPLVTVDEMPTMNELQSLQAANGRKIKVIEEVASRWMILGDLLEFDCRSKILDSIKQECNSVPNACCRVMLQRWIAGEGVKPCTWGKLVELIDNCGEVALSDEIKSALSLQAK